MATQPDTGGADYNAGYQAGGTAGYTNGYADGYDDGVAGVAQNLSKGDVNGGDGSQYSLGYNAGYKAQYDISYPLGYQAGAAAVASDPALRTIPPSQMVAVTGPNLAFMANELDGWMGTVNNGREPLAYLTAINAGNPLRQPYIFLPALSGNSGSESVALNRNGHVGATDHQFRLAFGPLARVLTWLCLRTPTMGRGPMRRSRRRCLGHLFQTLKASGLLEPCTTLCRRLSTGTIPILTLRSISSRELASTQLLSPFRSSQPGSATVRTSSIRS
jgi:hypothetical protein